MFIKKSRETRASATLAPLKSLLQSKLDSGDELYLVYQPRTHAVSGHCVSVEALVRWSHPEWGLIAPSEFMPLAEQSPLAERLTAWALNGAVSQLARWRAAGFDLDISINVSIENLRDADFASHVAQVLATHRIPSRHVELEITENAIMTDVGLALQPPARCQRMHGSVGACRLATLHTHHAGLQACNDASAGITRHLRAAETSAVHRGGTCMLQRRRLMHEIGAAGGAGAPLQASLASWRAWLPSLAGSTGGE